MAQGELKRIAWSDFSQGVNLRESPIDQAHFPYMLNFLPVGDRLRSRFGYVQTTTATEAQVVYMYKASTLDRLFTIAADGKVRCYTTNFFPFTLSAGALVGTLPTAQSYSGVSMCEINNTFVIGCPSGIFTCGTTAASLSAVVTALPSSGILAVWKNKVWCPSGNRLYYSNAGTAGTWTTGTDFVDIVEVDVAVITALGAGQGYDIQAQNQLNVFKDHSWYRVTDATTGSYQTMSVQHGAKTRLCLGAIGDTTYFGNIRGVYQVTGAGTSERISDPISTGQSVCTFLQVQNDHVLVSTNSQVQDYFEYVPETGAWFPQRSFPAAGVGSGLLVACTVPGIWGNVDGVVWCDNTNSLFVGPPPSYGTDNSFGQPIAVLDAGSLNFTANVRMPAISGRGNKIRVRYGYLTARAGGTVGAVWKTFSSISGQGRNDSPVRSFPSFNVGSDIGTQIQASMGAFDQLSLGLTFSGAAPAVIPPTSDHLNSTSYYLPALEIHEIAMDFIELGR